MALFHLSVTQVRRSAGQSAIASAAYRAGERLYSERYGEYSDYTRKGGVICSDILLPPQAPPEYQDRQTLWNAVEEVERHKDAQLAYSFDIALQNEFSLEENIALARQFLLEQFVSRGMVADFAVHQPDKEDGGIPNPHFHVLCPIRPILESGKWGFKQRRVYRLDENGNRILDSKGKPLFDAVPTTGWGSPETLEHWREAWAKMCNAKFEEKGLPCRIDHRSYLRQGLDLLPTVHEGPAVRQMEARGIATDKGSLNRWIRATNALLKDLKRRIAALLGWLGEVREELSKPQAPALADLLGAYYGARNAGAWSSKAKTGNLQRFADTVNYLTEQKLYTVDDLEARVTSHNERIEELKASMNTKQARMKELDGLLEQAERYRELKPIHDQMNAIHRQGQREKFKAAHEGELRQFYMARRKLKDHFSPEGRLPLAKWKTEYGKLQQAYQEEYAAYKPIREDLMKLYQVKSVVDSASRQQEQTHTQRRDRDMER